MKTKQIFDTVYSIREDGVVITGKGGILKPKLTKNGYHELALYDSGTKKYTWYRLNRLVAMMFIPNPENNHSLLSQIHLNILPTIITPLYL